VIDYERFFTINLDLLCIADTSGNFIRVNKAWERILGYSASELENRKFLDFIHPDDVSATLNAMSDLRANKQVLNFINRYRCQDGSYRFVEWRSHPYGEFIYAAARDITSQQFALQKFYKLFDCNPAIMAVVTLDGGKFVDVNAAFVETLGYSRDEIIGHTVKELGLITDEHQRKESKDDIHRVGSIQNREIKVRKKDGSILEGVFSGEVIDDQGVKSFLVVIIDRTQQRQAERELKESEMRLNTAINNAKIGLWEWHVKTGETYFNEQWANLIGYTLEEISPVSIDTWIRFVHPDDLAASNEKLAKCFKGETEYYECEARVKHKNGEWVWVLDRGKVVEWDENGEPLLMLGTHINIDHIKKVEQELIYDISERKRMETELNKKERILSAVALSIKELLDEKDYYTAVKRCFSMLGEAAQVDRVYLFQNSYDDKGNGRTSQKIEWTSSSSTPQLSNAELQQIPFEDIDFFIKPLLEGNPFYGIVREFEDDRVQELLADQEILSIVVLPIYVRNTFWGFMGFDECKYERVWTKAEFSTLSAFVNSLEKAIERRLVEEELEQSKRAADEANAAKSLFLANMSHEIRTPINGVLGIIDLLSKDTLSNEQKVYIDVLRKSTESLVNIINDILDLSKIESGKMELYQMPFELRESVREAVKLMQPLIDEKELEVIINISEDLPKYLLGDFEKIKQILLNLLSNAVKFTSKGNIEIAIRGERIKEDYFRVEFLVKDTGVGISKEKIKSIFEPFVQADNTVSRRYGGTGLGLSICQKLVEMMAGRIWIKSSLGIGTEVYFLIHLEEAMGKVPQCLEVTNYKIVKRPLHILIAEDNEVNQMLICKVLENEGYTFKLAANGREAIELFDKEAFDVILMDIQMPEMDGYTAARHIRQKEKDTHIPIVALTAHAMKDDKAKCIEAGMDYYLTKPIYFNKLFAVFDEIFEERQAANKNVNTDAVNAGEIFEKLNSDEAFFKLIVKKFENSAHDLMGEIRLAVLTRDGDKLRTSAHALKGAIAVFEANKTLELAKELEMMGYNENFKDADHAADQLEASIRSIITSFNDFIARGDITNDKSSYCR
jgi:PAS domain S-box-containing protein